ncbi:hypothetical protein PFLUOLIPICF7_17035 [Pseudomonas simiae]|nr:hypothetical protein PFLUOLIPICF7_17035 [Pseudomonas simiae]
MASDVARIWLISHTVLPSEAQRSISSSVGVKRLPARLIRRLTALGTKYGAANDLLGPLISFSPFLLADVLSPFGFLLLTDDINVLTEESYIRRGIKAWPPE